MRFLYIVIFIILCRTIQFETRSATLFASFVLTVFIILLVETCKIQIRENKELKERRNALINELSSLAKINPNSFSVIFQRETNTLYSEHSLKSLPESELKKICALKTQIKAKEKDYQYVAKSQYFNDLIEVYGEKIIINYAKIYFRKDHISELEDREKGILIDKYKEIIQFAKENRDKEYKSLEKAYPLGIKRFSKENRGTTYEPFDLQCLRIGASLREKMKHGFREELSKYHAPIIDYAISQKIVIESYEKLEKWRIEQIDFSSKCLSLRNKYLASYGCYKYDIELQETINNFEYKDTFFICQIFKNAFCTEADLDYSIYSYVRNNNLINTSLMNKTSYFSNDVIDKIVNYIDELQGIVGKIKVLIGCDICEELNNFHFSYFRQKLAHKQIDCLININELSFVPSINRIVVVELITFNKALIETCLDIIRQYKTVAPVIAYISLQKEYSRNEMIWLIKKEGIKKRFVVDTFRQQLECEERNRKEEEEKARIEAEFQLLGMLENEEKQRKEEEERAKIEYEILYGRIHLPTPRLDNKDDGTYEKLKSCIKSWSQLRYSNIRYFSMYNYYPMTCDFIVTEWEWNVRKMIWNFKNNPRKTTRLEHQIALRHVLTATKKVLRFYFGDNVCKLTLVCIAASTKEINKLRYEVFSQTLCNDLGMTNSYPYIQILQDGTPKHLGGGEQSTLYFDPVFFQGKYILLFDDVITKGNSMEKYRRKMESLGAIVIGGLSIGKTRHERLENNSDPIDMIKNGRVGSDLPF